MIKILLAITLFTFSHLSVACDESCKRAKAETKNNIKFATYLNAKYCKQTSLDFLQHGKKSLQTYRDKQLPTAHRGGARNIRSFITQRQEWLQECDRYLLLTDQGRIFRDKETTDKIINVMAATAAELEKIMKRPKKPGEDLNVVVAPASKRFEELFKLMDAHYLELQRRGLI